MNRSGARALLVAGVLAIVLPLAAAPPAAGVEIRIGSAVGAPGDIVHVPVSLSAAGVAVAATGNDMTFDTRILSLDPAACRVNSRIEKSLIPSVVGTQDGITTVRVLVQASQNTEPISDGPLYTCSFRIAPSALPGTYRLDNELALAVSPDGAQLPNVTGPDGFVTVSLIGRACAGDCDGNAMVTINELIVGTSIALGNRPVDDCLSFDENGDGVVTINEIVTAVGNALTGCVLPPTPTPSPTATPTPPPTGLFVRASGSDTSSGTDPANALRTISAAVRAAQSGYQIIVGPGQYDEGVTPTGPGTAPQNLKFLADVSGELTGDPPGVVLIDATGTPVGAGFKFSNASGTVIDGFSITGGADGGIVLKSGSNGVTIRNCTIFDNPGSGIRVQDSIGTLVFNNLIYGNGAHGVGLVGQILGSPQARVFSNTIVGNGDRGLTFGTTSAPSEEGLVRNNILQGNGTRTDPPLENIKVFTQPRSDAGYDEDFNLVFPRTYLPLVLAGPHDVPLDPAFSFPSGADFHLRLDSPAIDAGDRLPPDLEAVLFIRTTTGTTLDSGPLDLGFHFLP